MSLANSIKKYQLDNGVVVPFSEQPSDHSLHHLITALYLDLSAKVSEPMEYDLETDGKYDDFKTNTEIVDGLYQADPSAPLRPIYWEELVAIASTDRSRALKIYNYGELNNGNFDNRTPYDKTGHGKLNNHLVTMPYYKARAGLELTVWDKIKWVVGAFKLVSTNSYHSLAALNLMIKAMKNQHSWILNLGINKFKNVMNERYEDLSGLYTVLFYSKHPLTIYSKGVKF